MGRQDEYGSLVGGPTPPPTQKDCCRGCPNSNANEYLTEKCVVWSIVCRKMEKRKEEVLFSAEMSPAAQTTSSLISVGFNDIAFFTFCIIRACFTAVSQQVYAITKS